MFACDTRTFVALALRVNNKKYLMLAQLLPLNYYLYYYYYYYYYCYYYYYYYYYYYLLLTTYY